VRSMAGIVAVQLGAIAKSRQLRVMRGIPNKNIRLMPHLSASHPVGAAIAVPAIPPTPFTSPS